MESENDHIKYIEAYLNNELSEDERKEFERKMEQEPDFRKEVEMHRELHAAFQEHGRQQLRKRLEDFYTQHKENRFKNRRIKTLIPVASIAAILVVLIAIIIPNQKTPDPNPNTITLDSVQIDKSKEYADSATYELNQDSRRDDKPNNNE